MSRLGWIKLYRDIWESPIWQDGKSFDNRSAFIDIIMLANFTDKTIVIDSKAITVKRGSFITSQANLCKRWNWGVGKLRRYLDLCANLGMIEWKAERRWTTIKVLNYAIYQGFEEFSGMKSEAKRNEVGTETEQKQNENGMETETTNKVNNINKGKESKEVKNVNSHKTAYAEAVFMTEDEYQKIAAKVGLDGADTCIEILNNYKLASGKKYQSDYRAILLWVLDKYRKECSKPNKNDWQACNQDLERSVYNYESYTVDSNDVWNL